MKLVVVSSAPIVVLNKKKYMYGPYHKEMKIWAKYVDEIQFCCPIWIEDRGLLIDEISFTALYGKARTGFDVANGDVFGFNTDVNVSQLLNMEALDFKYGFIPVVLGNKCNIWSPTLIKISNSIDLMIR